MSTKSVRLEPNDEERLKRIRRRTGWTASDALKRGLRLLERDISDKPPASAFELYTELELGPGGYAAGPSSRSQGTARAVIRRKHKR